MADRRLPALAFGLGAVFLGSAVPPSMASDLRPAYDQAQPDPLHTAEASKKGLTPPAALLAELGPPPPPPPPTAAQAMKGGVLIVVSLESQRAFVFRKGEVWDSTEVSTGKAGHDTPEGVFPILQKKVDHRSSLYDDAPMPYMQRLTWSGVALHAGNVPGYPASHGCIRLPKAFAKKLYGITNFSSTVVVVTDERLGSAQEAREAV